MNRQEKAVGAAREQRRHVQAHIVGAAGAPCAWRGSQTTGSWAHLSPRWRPLASPAFLPHHSRRAPTTHF
ncbi:hypothetical protein E2C01_059739 [Portunus trituberculatus]|uniref:Uncharacterized protein n=1 Tax=Portunus trituberculatus TaxID=210409 RepID=A0A5B7GZ80_PORTR|nr:hypothetical protein [Portunus trituberculatus]